MAICSNGSVYESISQFQLGSINQWINQWIRMWMRQLNERLRGTPHELAGLRVCRVENFGTPLKGRTSANFFGSGFSR